MKTPCLWFTAALSLLAALNAQANKAVLNADGVLEIDGQKVFVIGFTAAPPPDGKAPNGRAAFAELADAGATFVRAGPEQPWSEARFAHERKYEEAAARYGLHCWLNLREVSALKPGDTTSEELLRKVLTTFRNHPGLGVYKGADEPEWGKEPLPPLERAYQVIKELDPDHPLVIIQAPRGTIDSMREYNPVCDITGADIYPVSYPPGQHSQFVKTNAQISMVGDYTRRMMEVAEGKKPVWMTLQIAWSGVLKEGRTLRFPTFPEQRFMTWQAIINGARGLNYFGGGLPGGWNEEDRKLGWNWHFWNRVLRPVIEEIGTKSPLYPALVAPGSQLPVTVKGEGIEFCLREVGNDIFLLACKREGATIQARFSGLPENATGGEVLFESPRKVEIKQGAFTDWFGPFEVHLYRFSREIS
ncbi:MAG: hypothetical protein ABSD29_08295 [Verrucomicrobiota bacterium]|jgi:hypothetical protein